MNKLDLFKVMDLIDDDLVREAEITQKAAEDAENSGNTVSGVEVYRVPAWRRFTSLAAALVLALGVGAGGVYLMKHRPPMTPGETDTAPTADIRETTPAPTQTTENTAKESTDISSVPDSEAVIPGPTAAEEPASEPHAVELPAENTEGDLPVVELPVENTEGELPAVELPHYAEVTTPEGVPVPVTTTEPVSDETAYVPEDSQYIYDRLASLTYCQETCDGLPEYTLYAPDGTIYYISFTGGWVWRNGTEEAVLPADVALAIQTQMNKLYGGPTQWNDPISPAPNS